MGCFGGFFGFISVHRNSVSAQLPKHTETPFRLNYRTEPKFRSNTKMVGETLRFQYDQKKQLDAMECNHTNPWDSSCLKGYKCAAQLANVRALLPYAKVFFLVDGHLQGGLDLDLEVGLSNMTLH